MTNDDAKAAEPKLEVLRARTIADVVKLRPIALEYHQESRYAHIPFSEEKFYKVYSNLVENEKSGLSIYVQRGDEILGILGAQVGDYFLGQGGRIANTFVVFVPARVRHTMLGGRVTLRLIRVFMDWAKAMGAEEVNIHATSGIEPEQTDKFMRKLGLQPYGGSYAGRVG